MKLALAIGGIVLTAAFVLMRLSQTLDALATLPSVIRDCRKHLLVALSWVVFMGAFIMALYAHDDLHSVWLTVLCAIVSCAGAVGAIFLPEMLTERARRSRTR